MLLNGVLEYKKRKNRMENYSQSQDMPWVDIRLTEEIMNHLRNAMDTPVSIQKGDNKTPLAGNISKSTYIQDKDNLFYETVLKEMSEHLYYKDWNNHYNVFVTKFKSPPVFKLYDMWVNYQKQHEFNPPHQHTGEFSFIVFMKIPTYWKEQHALPFSANSNIPCASDFQFIIGQGMGGIGTKEIPLSLEDEGRMLFFPAWLQHQVFPFYECEEERITISGNIIYNLEKKNESFQR